MNIVKLFRERPLVFCIINFETVIWGYTIGMSIRIGEIGTLEIEGVIIIRVRLDSDLYLELERIGTDLL
jgi:hypothetical protein